MFNKQELAYILLCVDKNMTINTTEARNKSYIMNKICDFLESEEVPETDERLN